MELMDVIDNNLNVEEKETWKIKDDLMADWALEKVRERAAEHKRLVEVAEARKLQLEKVIEDERKRYENETSFFKSKLAEYFETVSGDAEIRVKTSNLMDNIA